MLLFAQNHPVTILVVIIVTLVVGFELVKIIVAFLKAAIKSILFLMMLYFVFTFSDCNTQHEMPKHRLQPVSFIDNKRKKPSHTKKIKYREQAFIRLRDTYCFRGNALNRQKSINHASFIKKDTVDKDRVFVLIVGPFDSENEAKAFLERAQNCRYPFEGWVFTSKSTPVY